jgi:phosphoribosylaminoimidazole carboxylase PurE protein
MHKPRVAIIIGSKSDLDLMREAANVLDEFGVDYDMRVLSAHRSPDAAREYALSAESRGIEVLIAGAGAAAHLAGFLAAHTVLPVVGVPVDSSPLRGLDALLSTVQMPPGVPVAAMAVGKAGARNAGFFAVQILGRGDPGLVAKLKEHRVKMQQEILSIEL